MQFHMMAILDVLGKIAWVREVFYPRVKSEISLSGVQEKLVFNRLERGLTVSFFFLSHIVFLTFFQSSFYFRIHMPSSLSN